MQNELIADLTFSRYLLVGKQLDPLLPTDPVSVHILLRLLQVHRSLGSDAYSGVDLLQQDTNISDDECHTALTDLEKNGLIEIRDRSAIKLADEGLVRSLNLEDLRSRSLDEKADSAFPGLRYGINAGLENPRGLHSNHPDPVVRARSNELLAAANKSSWKLPSKKIVKRSLVLFATISAIAFYLSNGPEVGVWRSDSNLSEIYIFPNHEASIYGMACSWRKYSETVSITCQGNRLQFIIDDDQYASLDGTRYRKVGSL